MCDCLPFDVEWKRKKSINQMHAHTPRNTFDNKSKNQQHPQWKRIVKSGRRYTSREYIPLCFKLNFTMLHVTLTLYAQQEFVVIHLCTQWLSQRFHTNIHILHITHVVNETYVLLFCTFRSYYFGFDIFLVLFRFVFFCFLV